MESEVMAENEGKKLETEKKTKKKTDENTTGEWWVKQEENEGAKPKE